MNYQKYDPRQLGQNIILEEVEMDGLGDRQKAQNAKRDKLHASAVKRNNENLKKQKEKKK